MKLFTFQVDLDGDVLSGESYPLYDDKQTTLLGGFTLLSGSTIKGFVSSTNHPTGLFISEGEPFYITPKEDESGKVASAIISEFPISVLSTVIKKAYSENLDDRLQS